MAWKLSTAFVCAVVVYMPGVEKLTLLDVESRNGYLFCQMCNDFVFDPTLEGLRLRKIGTGSFSCE